MQRSSNLLWSDFSNRITHWLYNLHQKLGVKFDPIKVRVHEEKNYVIIVIIKIIKMPQSFAHKKYMQ